MKPTWICLLLVGFFVALGLTLECSTPCSELDTRCRTSTCDTTQGVCTSKVIIPIPAGCCVENQQCEDGNKCTLDTCNFNTNTCEPVWICETPVPTPFQRPDRACKTSADCDDGDFCTSDVCDANGRCFSQLSKPLPVGCCSSTADCPSFPCTNSYCNFIDFRCVYQKKEGCQISGAPGVFNSSAAAVAAPPPPDDEPGVGDIIGAIIGFIILGLLVLAFVIVVLMILVRNIIAKITQSDS